MAYTSGTASNYADLMDRFVTFVTAGINATENWTLLTDRAEDIERVVYLRAPGLTGTESIYTSLYRYSNVGADYYNWGIRGYTGHNAALGDRGAQPGGSPGVYLPLWNASIPYWFVANGRRAIIVAKVSTTYQWAYLGLMLPYASPTEYAYPHTIGGMDVRSDARWSDPGYQHNAFWKPAGSLILRSPSSSWVGFSHYSSAGSLQAPSGTAPRMVWPTFYNFMDGVGKTMDGGYILNPLMLFDVNAPARYGELQGVYALPGYQQASENIITISGVQHLVVQNGALSGGGDYAALRLE